MRSLVIVALAAGCYRGGEPAKPAQPLEARPAAPPPHARTALDPLGFLPIDSELVAHLDANQLRQSSLWPRLEPRLMTKAADTIRDFRTECGFDPLPMIASIAIGMRGIDTPELRGVVVVRGVPRAQLMPCFHKAAARQPSVGSIDRHGIITVRGDGTEPPLVFAFADARTIVMVAGHGASGQALRDVLDGGAPLRASASFMEMYARIDSRRAAWFFLNGTSKALDSTRTLGFAPRALFGSADVTSGLAAKLVVRTPTPADAQNLVTMVQGQLGAMQSLVAKLDVAAEDADVVIDLALTDDQLAMIAGLLGP